MHSGLCLVPFALQPCTSKTEPAFNGCNGMRGLQAVLAVDTKDAFAKGLPFVTIQGTVNCLSKQIYFPQSLGFFFCQPQFHPVCPKLVELLSPALNPINNARMNILSIGTSKFSTKLLDLLSKGIPGA